AAVLRQAAEPMTRAAVERAVVITLLPRLVEAQLGKHAKSYKRLVGEEAWARRSIDALRIPWPDVVEAARREHLLEVLDEDRWRPGDTAGDRVDPILEARAAVALSWMATRPAAAEGDTEIE